MAKPVDNVGLWAKDNVYTNGPYAGLANKQTIPGTVVEEGFLPGAANPSAAEHVNDYFNRLSAIARWVFAGSFGGEADAHIVETDGDGQAQLAQLYVSPIDVNTYGARFDGGPAGSAYAVQVINTTADDGMLIQSSVGTALAVESVGEAGFAVYAQAIQTAAQTSRPALFATGSATQAAVYAQGVGAGDTIYALAGSTADQAIEGDGNTDSAGVVGRGGTSSGDGVLGYGRSTLGAGVRGETDAAAGILAGGLVGVGYGDGNGVIAFAEDGWALVVDAPGGDKAPILVDHRAGDYGNSTDGQIAVKSDDGGTGYHFRFHMGEWRSPWHTKHGYCGLVATAGSAETNTNTTAMAAKNFGAYNAPKQVGKVEVCWVGEVGRTGTCQIDVGIYDVTAGVYVDQRTFNLYDSGAGVYERTETIRAVYTLPASGDRSFRVDIERNGGGGADLARVRNQTLSVRGVFD